MDEASVRNIPREPWQEWLGRLGAELGEIKKTSRALAGTLPGTAYPPQIAAWLLENAAIGDKPEVLENLSYGFPPTKGGGLATQVDPKALELADFLPWGTLAKGGKAIAAALEAVGAKTGLAGAAIGALRAGGPRDLMPSHGTGIGGIMRGTELLPELYSPSLAVQKGELDNPFEAGLTLIPRLGVADPRYSTATLFNRDAYLARKGDYRGFAPGKYQAYERLWDRFEAKPGPGTEGRNWFEWDNPLLSSNLGLKAAVLNSPIFPSFRHFESSPAGAGVLRGDAKPFRAAEDWGYEVKDLLVRGGFLDDPSARVSWDSARRQLHVLAQSSGPEAKEAQKLLQDVKRIPSTYAELKFHGPLPLTKEYWAGALYKPGALPEGSIANRFFAEMERRGIKMSRQSTTPMHGTENLERADILQRLAGPIKWGDINKKGAVVEPVSARELALVTEASPEQIPLFPVRSPLFPDIPQ